MTNERSVVDYAHQLLDERRAVGKERYGVELKLGNGRDGRDADEEMADWFIYWVGYRIEHAKKIRELYAMIGKQGERIKQLESALGERR